MNTTKSRISARVDSPVVFEMHCGHDNFETYSGQDLQLHDGDQQMMQNMSSKLMRMVKTQGQ